MSGNEVVPKFCKFIFSCHPEDVSPKDLIFQYFLKRSKKQEILRFARNDNVNFLNTFYQEVDIKNLYFLIF